MAIWQKSWITWGAILIAIAILFVLNIVLGSVEISIQNVLDVLMGCETAENSIYYSIIWKSRLPQTLTAFCAGMGLSVSGLLMQTIFRNPLAGPSELGISSGASLGAALVILLSGSFMGEALSRIGFWGEMAITIGSIIGSLSVMALILLISRRIRGSAVLLIMGVMIGYIATAIIGVLKFFSNDEDVRSYVIWGLGSFSKVSGGNVYLFIFLMMLLIPISFLLVKRLNLMLLGDNYARNLGLNVRQTRLWVIAHAGILTAIVTAYCGPIIFLGLAVPHLCRSLLGTSDHRILLPGVVLVGGALALLCNLIARLPGFEGALPINSVTALIGAPIVISVLLRKKSKAWT